MRAHAGAHHVRAHNRHARAYDARVVPRGLVVSYTVITAVYTVVTAGVIGTTLEVADSSVLHMALRRISFRNAFL